MIPRLPPPATRHRLRVLRRSRVSDCGRPSQMPSNSSASWTDSTVLSSTTSACRRFYVHWTVAVPLIRLYREVSVLLAQPPSGLRRFRLRHACSSSACSHDPSIAAPYPGARRPPFVPGTRPDHLQRADRLLPLSRHNRVHRRSGACLIVQVARPGERLVALVASGSHRFARPTSNCQNANRRPTCNCRAPEPSWPCVEVMTPKFDALMFSPGTPRLG